MVLPKVAVLVRHFLILWLMLMIKNCEMSQFADDGNRVII